MLAFKTQLNINSELLFLKIPGNFKGKRVEVIILETYENYDVEFEDYSNEIETFYDSFSIEKNEDEIKVSNPVTNKFQKILLSAPTWSDNEYQNFVETRKLFNKWKID